MLIDFPSPVLTVAADVLNDLDGTDALTGLWFLFTKCKSSLHDGRRLENISWRLWHRELAANPSRYRPMTPDTPSEFATLPEAGTSPLRAERHPPSSPRPPIGRVIYEILPKSSSQVNTKYWLPNGTTKVELEVTNTPSLLPTPAAELLSISIIPPVQGTTSSFTPPALSTPHNTNHRQNNSRSFTVVSHASPPPPPQSSLSSSNSGTGTPSTPFPLVVVVNPTPNPTPHPTPPATPVIPPTVAIGSDAHTHVALPSPQQLRQPARLLLPPAMLTKRPSGVLSLSQAQSLHQSEVNGHGSSSELSYSPTTRSRSNSRSPIPDALLPPSPSTSNSIASNSPVSASPLTTASDNSHTTLSTTTSTTSVNSAHPRSPDATLKPQDARKFFLHRSREGDHSSPSSGSQSSARNDTLVMTKARPDSRSTSSHTNCSQTRSVATETGLDLSGHQPDSGVEARGYGYMAGKPRVTRQSSTGQSSTSARSASWSEGESDAEGVQHLVMQTRKSRRRGSSSTRASVNSTQSRSRSRGRSAHDGLIMSRGRKKVMGGASSGGSHHGVSHHAHTVGRKGGRAAVALHAQGHAHGNGALQPHVNPSEGETSRVPGQGQGQKRGSHSRADSQHVESGHVPVLNGSASAGSGSTSASALGVPPPSKIDHEQARVKREREMTVRPNQTQTAQILQLQQAHAQPQLPVQGLTPGHKRPTFNIGSNSTGSPSTESPSNTDLSKSSERRGLGVGARDGAMLPLVQQIARAQTQPQLNSGKGKEREVVALRQAAVPPPALTPAPQPQQLSQPQAPKPNNALAQPRGLPPAMTNLAAAEAMIQAHHEKAQVRPRKVVVATDDDDDDWDETETDTDVETDFEDESFVEMDKNEEAAAENAEDEGNESGDWTSDDAGEVEAAKASKSKGAGSSKKSAIGVQLSNGGPNNSLKRPGHARHTSQPNLPTVASIAKQKHQQQLLAQQAPYGARQQPAGPPVAPQLQQRSSRHGRSEREREREREARQQALTDQKLREAALEVQRQRDMFVKVPPRSYSNLTTRSRSGLLSQLMNPDPNIFPDNHPYRRGHSSGDVVGNGSQVARIGIQPMTNLNAEKSGISAAAPVEPSASRPSVNGAGKASGAVAPPPPPAPKTWALKPSKSAVALPVANSVTASSFSDKAVTSSKGKEKQREVSSGNGGGYRPKGRPQDLEMEDESETDDAEALQMSRSAAQEKLAALVGRRNAGTGKGSGVRTNSDSVVRKQSLSRPSSSRYGDPIPAPPVQRAQSQFIPNANAPRPTPAVPLPLGFPYNLPPAAPPSSPRTTRQLMLRTEMSESLRQNLLWHRQQSKAELMGPRRKSSTALSGPGLKPLTTISAVPSLVHLTAKKKPGEPGQVTSVGGTSTGKDEWDVDGRPSKMTRNRSWAGGGR